MSQLLSKIFSGVTISSAGQGLIVKNVDTGIPALIVDTAIPSVTIIAPLLVSEIIVEDLSVSHIDVGNPPIAIPTSLIHVYDNDAGLEPQVVIEQDGTGDVGLEFLLTGGASYMSGIGNSSPYAFRIAYAGAGGPPVLGVDDVLILEPSVTGNVVLGFDGLNNIGTGVNNVVLGSNSGNALTGTDSNNILISNAGVVGDSGEIRIGTPGIHTSVVLPGGLSLVDEQYETPLDGATVNITSNTSVVIIDPAVSIAALTINMPATPRDGKIIKIDITENITVALVHNGNGNTLIAPFPSTIVANATGTWYFRAANSTWYPISVPSDGTATGAGDVNGPGSSTDNAVARFDGVSGKLIQNSGVILDDTNNMTGINSLAISPTTALALQVNPFGVLAGNTGEVRMLELAASGTNYTGFKSPDALAGNVIYTLPTADGGVGNVLSTNGAGALSWTAAGTGDVAGPGASTDNALARFDGATGKIIQNSVGLLSDSGNLSGIANLNASNVVLTPTTALAIRINPFGVAAGNTGEVRLLELVANGVNYTGFKSPDALAGNVIYTMPNADGTSGQFLQTNGSATLTWANANDLPTGYVTGLLISDNTASTKDISVGSCRSDDDTANIIVSATLTPDITASGANGLDVGVEASDTWYSIWVIDGSAVAVASLLSTSSTSPTLPVGYTVKRRVGWVRNDSASDFLDYSTESESRSRVFNWSETLTTVTVLSGGAATVFTSVDISSLVPPTCETIYLLMWRQSGGNNNTTELRPGGSSIDPPSYISDRTYITFQMPCSSSQTIEYRQSNTGGSNTTDLYILGYTDEI